jgi:hypothetical protein
MSVTPSPIGGFAAQFFDNNGVILSGGKIFTYSAGTSTPQATYTSASGVTPHANPIILDSAGRVPGGEIWLTDGLVYKFVIETAASILIGTYDNITGVNSNFVNYTVQEEVITATAGQTVFNLSTINYTPGTNSLSVYIDGVNQYVGDSYLETDSDTVTFTSGVHVGGEVKFTTAVQTTTGAVDASIVSYTYPAVGAVGQTVQTRLEQYVSVKDFGAVGDGVADDTAAFQAAVSAAAVSGFDIFIPSGNTFLVSTQTLLNDGVSMYGTGTINYSGVDACFATASAISFFEMNGVLFSSAGKLLDVGHNIDRIKIENCSFTLVDKVIETVATAITLENISIINNHIYSCKGGFQFAANVIGQAYASGNVFEDISDTGAIFCLLFGNNNTTDQDNRGDYVVVGNTFKNIVSSSVSAETHAVICYGKRAAISANSVQTINNAGTTGAEAIYTKTRFAAVTGNTIEDGGYSGNGAIAIKGQERGGSAAPFGYGCSVVGNVVKADGVTSGSIGIYLQNESITCSGNYLEGHTSSAISIAVVEGKAVGVTSNTIAKSASNYGIICDLDCDDVVISNNIISDFIGLSATASSAIYIGTGTVGPKRMSILGNVISVDATSTATTVDAIQINTENDGSTFENFNISHNVADVSAAGNGRGIRILGVETINNLNVIGNQITADGLNEFEIASTVVVSGVANFSGNKFGGVQSVASPFTLDWEDVNQPVIYTGAVNATFTLPEATVGATFTVINGDTTGASVGFIRSGADTFRGGSTQATIAAKGAISVTCFVAGTWDIISATSAVTYV